MNNDATNKANDKTVTPENESTVDADTTASAIAPDTHFLSSGLKLGTELFSKGNIKKIVDNDTIENTPTPDAPGYDTPDSASQYSGSNDSNSPYSLRNLKFAP